MSEEASVWAWQQDVSGTEKLVLLAVASGASSRGVCVESQEDLAAKTGVHETTVRKNLKRLEGERELLHREPRYSTSSGGREVDAIVLHMDPADPPGGAPANPRAERPVSPRAERPASARGGSSSSSSSTSGDADQLFRDPELEADAAHFLKTKRKVGSKVVTAEEMAIAVAALSAFNRAGETSFGLGAHLTPIVGRIRERPTWDAAKFVRLVESAWRLRWWEKSGRGGRATPAVVFGNERCFERVALDAADEAAGRTEKIEERSSYMKDVIE